MMTRRDVMLRLFIPLCAAPSAAVVTDLAAAFPTLSSINRPSASALLLDLAAAADAADSAAIDVYGSSSWLNEFEAEVAEALGKPAAVFVVTGVAAQNMALCVHANLPFRAHRTEPSPSFVMHGSSHLALYEEKAYDALLGLTPLVAGEIGKPLSASDIEYYLARLAAVGTSPSAILVEVPMRELGCTVPTWDELLELRALATRYNVPLHLDGARLWEASAYYEEVHGKTMADVCALFDSAYVSFYKGLGAISGAMLLGSEAFIARAKPWRRRLGANPFTLFPFALSSRLGFRKHVATFAARRAKLRGLAPQLREAAAAEGGSLRIVPPEPQCCQCFVFLGRGCTAEALDAARDAVQEQLGLRVYGRLRGDPAFRSPATADAEDGEGGAWEHYFEWTVGPAHTELDDAVFVEAWTAFFRALRDGGSSID